METKNIIESRTIWFNLLMILLFFVGNYLSKKYGIVLDEDIKTSIVTVVLTVGNIILRILTQKKITLRK
ncbi:MAG: hypothetical protein FJZ11_05870 [Candidatus Omnitrophica bacterium]|nr:hypothetical protein [Candidatus Omnitrophota bacterium]